MFLVSALLIKILLSLYFAVNRLNSMIVCNLTFSHIFCWLDTESKLNRFSNNFPWLHHSGHIRDQWSTLDHCFCVPGRNISLTIEVLQESVKRSYYLVLTAKTLNDIAKTYSRLKINQLTSSVVFNASFCSI